MMKVLKIYLADNGDIFFQHDSLLEDRTNEEIQQLIKDGYEAYKKESVEFVHCKAIHNDTPIEHISYKLLDGSFVGEAGMHVTVDFSIFQ